MTDLIEFHKNDGSGNEFWILIEDGKYSYKGWWKPPASDILDPLKDFIKTTPESEEEKELKFLVSNNMENLNIDKLLQLKLPFNESGEYKEKIKKYTVIKHPVTGNLKKLKFENDD